MKFLWTPTSHFNLANLFTFVNITAGLSATYFITQNNFTLAIVLAWVGGAFGIFDGKIARKYNLSNEFGIQLDSFADFLSFVLVPVFLIFKLHMPLLFMEFGFFLPQSYPFTMSSQDYEDSFSLTLMQMSERLRNVLLVCRHLLELFYFGLSISSMPMQLFLHLL